MLRVGRYGVIVTEHNQRGCAVAVEFMRFAAVAGDKRSSDTVRLARTWYHYTPTPSARGCNVLVLL